MEVAQRKVNLVIMIAFDLDAKKLTILPSLIHRFVATYINLVLLCGLHKAQEVLECHVARLTGESTSDWPEVAQQVNRVSGLKGNGERVLRGTSRAE